MASEDQDLVLRVWTPVILRSVLITAMIVMVVGLIAMVVDEPGSYVTHFRRLQSGARNADYRPLSALISMAWRGDARSIMTLGLMTLTLVPLARVAFCWLYFLETRNWTFVLFTSYVLAGLAVGVMLGRIG